MNSTANTVERKMTCSTAAKSSCFPSPVEDSQAEKPSKNLKNVPNNECTSKIKGLAGMLLNVWILQDLLKKVGIG